MLSERRCVATIPASDLERAKKWYGTLGFTPKYEVPGGIEYTAGDGTAFLLYASQYAGTNQATAMTFEAKDISAEVEELKSRGVTLEEYDLPGIKTVDGIAELPTGERGVWFKDSEGNILALFESPRSS